MSMRSHGIVLDPRHQSCVFPILVMECRPRRGEEYGFCEASSTSEMVELNEINIHIIPSPYNWNLMGIYLNDQRLLPILEAQQHRLRKSRKCPSIQDTVCNLPVFGTCGNIDLA